jgi:hypothetical protein
VATRWIRCAFAPCEKSCKALAYAVGHAQSALACLRGDAAATLDPPTPLAQLTDRLARSRLPR